MKTTWPHFLVVSGVLSVSKLQYTVQKHEVFNGWFPRCVRIVKVWWCREKAGFCIWIGNPFNSQTELENVCHIYTEKRGIHSLFVKWRSNFHAMLGNRSILLPLTSSGSKIDIWEDSWDNCKPSPLFLLKMIMIIKSSCLHDMKKKENEKKTVFWIKIIQILSTSTTGITSIILSAISPSHITMDDIHIYTGR